MINVFLNFLSEPCQIAKYKIKKRFNVFVNSYHPFFIDDDKADSLSKKKKNYKYLTIKYSTTDTLIIENSLFMNFSKFLSLLGGNLGLLLGLSCITSLFVFYNYFGTSIAPWKRIKMQIWFIKFFVLNIMQLYN